VFEAGSVSKQFTVAAVLLLEQQGKLSIDDAVRKHVPELPDYGAPLTLRHLVHHTSGLRDWGTVVDAAGWPRGSRIHTHAHVLEVLARQRSLNFPTGTEFLYSNSGYNLLAIIVERVSGQGFSAFTREHLFEPLGALAALLASGKLSMTRFKENQKWTLGDEGLKGDVLLLEGHGSTAVLIELTNLDPKTPWKLQEARLSTFTAGSPGPSRCA
jgi:CubicO group peptidase (beta-lactamase class C family)